MNLLLDTHALFWSIYDVPSLSPEAADALADPDNTVWVTLASAQEISMKVGAGKWRDAIDLLLNFDARLTEAGYGLLVPVAADYANQLMLPDIEPHRDAYDKLIIAQALARGMTLVTSDGFAPDYGVPVIHAGQAPRMPERRQTRLVPVQPLTPIALPRAESPSGEGAPDASQP